MRILGEALASLLKRPFTRRYPKVKLEPFPRFAGRIHFYEKRCIGCKLCEFYCPVKAVEFYKKGKIDFDMNLCIYCGLCRDVCPTKPKSIELSTDFEYSDSDIKKVRKNIIRKES